MYYYSTTKVASTSALFPIPSNYLPDVRDFDIPPPVTVCNQKYLIKQFEIFHERMHLLKTSNLQGLQIAA